MGEQCSVCTCRCRTHSSMRVLVAVVLLLASCVGPALSFSTGAPREACNSVTPNHPATPQNTSNPYRIDLSVFEDGSGSLTYLPNRTYQCEFGKWCDYNYLTTQFTDEITNFGSISWEPYDAYLWVNNRSLLQTVVNEWAWAWLNSRFSLPPSSDSLCCW